MGTMEKESRKRTHRSEIRDFILCTVGTAGLLGVALVAPNVLDAMGKMGLSPGPRKKESIRRAQDRLVAQGILKLEHGRLSLSKRGATLLKLIDAGRLQARRPRRWDKKWRMIIFDIPEKKRSKRFQIRGWLKLSGFLMIQDSVWVYPYDCEDMILLIKGELTLGKEVIYCIVDAIEQDSRYRAHFKLR